MANTMTLRKRSYLIEASEVGSRLLIKCGSHRARAKFERQFPYREQLCSFRRDVGGGIFEVTKEELEGALKIKGITKAKDGNDLGPCWATDPKWSKERWGRSSY